MIYVSLDFYVWNTMYYLILRKVSFLFRESKLLVHKKNIFMCQQTYYKYFGNLTYFVTIIFFTYVGYKTYTYLHILVINVLITTIHKKLFGLYFP